MKKHCFIKKLLSVLLSLAVVLASTSVPTIAAENIQLQDDDSEVFMEEEIQVLEVCATNIVKSGSNGCDGNVHRFDNVHPENDEELCMCGESKSSEMVAIYGSNSIDDIRYFTEFGDAVTYIKGMQQYSDTSFLEIINECNYYDNIEFDYTEIKEITFNGDNAVLNLNNASLILTSPDEEVIRISANNSGMVTTIKNNSDAATIQGVFETINEKVTITNEGSGYAMHVLPGKKAWLKGGTKVESSGDYAICVESNGNLIFTYGNMTTPITAANKAGIYLYNGSTLSFGYSINNLRGSVSVETQNPSQILISDAKNIYGENVKTWFESQNGKFAEFDDAGNLVWIECSHTDINLGYCDKCKTTYEAAVTSDGIVHYYQTLEEAVQKAENDSVVTMLCSKIIDTTDNALEVEGKTITLDLNSYLLKPNITGDNVICISNGKVNIKNTGGSATGRIRGIIYIGSGGSLEIEGGYFPNGLSVENNSGTDINNLSNFLAKGYVYRNSDGKAFYPGDGLVNSEIYRVSPINYSQDVEVELQTTSFSYDGTEKKPQIVVSYDNHVMAADEYNISWPEDMVSSGDKTLVISGISEEMGSLEATYKITKAPLTISEVKVSDREYNGSDQIEITEVVLNGVWGTDEVYVSGTGITGTISSQDIGTYDAVRIYALTLEGKESGNYELALPVTVPVIGKITQKDICGSVSIEGLNDKTYTGSAQMQSLVVRDGSTTLVEGTDYTVTYKNNVDAGTASVIITGKGNYKGSVTKTFNILPIENGSESEKPEITDPNRNEPDQVRNLKVSKSTTKTITLKWNKVTGADGYNIFRRNSGTKKWKKLATTKKLTYTDKNLSSGKKYEYAVAAYNKKGGKTYTGKKKIIKTVATPASVKNLKVKKITKTAVTLSWKKVTNATGYIVYRQNTGNNKWVKVGTTNKTSYTNKKLKKGKNYKYAVSAYVSCDGKTYSSTKKTVNAKTKK